MSEALQLALINLIVRVGLEKAIEIFSGINKATTIDEAIAALRETQKKTWADYKAQA
jgi:hypothetical protein